MEACQCDAFLVLSNAIRIEEYMRLNVNSNVRGLGAMARESDLDSRIKISIQVIANIRNRFCHSSPCFLHAREKKNFLTHVKFINEHFGLEFWADDPIRKRFGPRLPPKVAEASSSKVLGVNQQRESLACWDCAVCGESNIDLEFNPLCPFCARGTPPGRWKCIVCTCVNLDQDKQCVVCSSDHVAVLQTAPYSVEEGDDDDEVIYVPSSPGVAGVVPPASLKDSPSVVVVSPVTLENDAPPKRVKPTLNSNTLVVSFDGCCKGNPGPGGGGWIVNSEELTLGYGFTYLPMCTNNEAEYRGLIDALTYISTHLLSSLSQESNIVIKGDSMLVVKQCKGEYRCKAVNLIPLYQEAMRLCQLVVATGCRLGFQWILRGENGVADYLSNIGLHLQSSFCTVPGFTTLQVSKDYLETMYKV